MTESVTASPVLEAVIVQSVKPDTGDSPIVKSASVMVTPTFVISWQESDSILSI